MKDFKYFDEHIATVPGFPKEGIEFKDVTTSIEDPECYQEVINAMADCIAKYDFDKIICAEARGFIFGAPLAYKLNKGLVIARKPNKLPRPGLSFSYHLEYGDNTLLISQGSIKPGEKIVVIDDLLATGGSANAMIQLALQSGAEVKAACFYIGLPVLKGDEFLKAQCPGLDVYTIVDFEDLV